MLTGLKSRRQDGKIHPGLLSPGASVSSALAAGPHEREPPSCSWRLTRNNLAASPSNQPDRRFLLSTPLILTSPHQDHQPAGIEAPEHTARPQGRVHSSDVDSHLQQACTWQHAQECGLQIAPSCPQSSPRLRKLWPLLEQRAPDCLPTLC